MSEADRVAELAVKAAGVATIVKSDNGRVFLLVPQGYAHHDITLDHALDVLRPKAIAQGVTLQNADALVAVWDGKSPGTKHMIDVAKARGLRIFVVS